MAQKIDNFREEEKEWNELTKRILNDETVNHKLGLLIKPEELEKSLADKLLEKEIAYIIVGNNKDCRKVEYEKKWSNNLGAQHFEWSNCENKKAEKGYYENLGTIEVFGIGNGWLVWVDSDAI